MPCLYIVLVQENISNPIPTWYLACHTSTLDWMSAVDSNGLDICTYIVENITKLSGHSYICPSYTIFVSPNILTNLFEETCPYHMKRNKHEMICVCKDWLQKLCKQWVYFHPQRPRWQQKVKVIISQQKPQPSTFHTPPPRLVAKVSDLSVVVIRENCSPWLQGALSSQRTHPAALQSNTRQLCSGLVEHRQSHPFERPPYEVRPQPDASTRLCKVI